MFKGNTTASGSKPVDMNSPDKLNRIVEGTSIQGDIKSDSNIRIDGKLVGTITTKGRLVVGKNGHIDGEVICQDADIEGTLIGKITVDQLLTLKSTANVSGDVLTNKLAIDPGAVLDGSCKMADKKGTSSSSSDEKSFSSSSKSVETSGSKSMQQAV